jgi:hypothetical protein
MESSINLSPNLRQIHKKLIYLLGVVAKSPSLQFSLFTSK